MKLFDYELGDWSIHGCNHWRVGNSENNINRLYIGLIYHGKKDEPMTWEMDCWGTGSKVKHGIFIEVENIYYSLYNPTRRKYVAADIEQVKRNIDILIPKISKFKMFI